MTKKPKWTTDDIIEVVFFVMLWALAVSFCVGVGSVMLKQPEAKASGQSECAKQPQGKSKNDTPRYPTTFDRLRNTSRGIA